LHGFAANDFHSKCDGHANTLTILKASESSFIFGGFTTIAWNSSIQRKSDPNAFLFSLINKDNKPLKIRIDPNKHIDAIVGNPSYGPIFGWGGNDIQIVSNSNTNMNNLT
jgi:hypothetical protein